MLLGIANLHCCIIFENAVHIIAVLGNAVVTKDAWDTAKEQNTSGKFTSLQDVLAMLQAVIDDIFSPQLPEFLQLVLRGTERSAAGELILPHVAGCCISSTMQLEALLKLRAKLTLHALSSMSTGDAKLMEDRLILRKFINCYLLSCLHLVWLPLLPLTIIHFIVITIVIHIVIIVINDVESGS